MMGPRQIDQAALFYEFSLERHVPATHLLRSIDRFVDLSEVRSHLAPFYSSTGRPSIDPELLVRMLLVGYCYGIRSERRLCEEVHLNLAYRWFCRLGLDGEVPDHSTFSKNRHGRFRDCDLLRKLFETVVRRCMAEGLVDGAAFAVDASLIAADANNQRSAAGSDDVDWEAIARTRRSVREYLDTLDEAAWGAASETVPAGAQLGEMMSHIDCWANLAKMVGLTPPPHGAWTDNNGKPIYFDSIDNSAYILGQAKHSARKTWVYINGETFGAVRADIGDDPDNPDVNIVWKYVFTAKDTWLGPTQTLGGLGALYNLTMDPYEKYDMFFNGAVATRAQTNSPGKYAGMDNGWAIALLEPVIVEFDKSIVDFPNIKRIAGGASNDQIPNLQNPENPVPALDLKKPHRHMGGMQD
jgi:transposase